MPMPRVDWVDIAKGICIVMVVMMHSTYGVQEALGSEGFMQAVVEFAKPFRMPDFFLISGLFLGRVIDRDWRTYLDRKVVHFAYFYLIWTAIQLGVKAPGLAAAEGLDGVLWRAVATLWAPFGTMWFLYMLPLFFVVTKLARRWPRTLLAAAAGLYLAHSAIETAIAPVAEDAFMLAEFAQRYVFFVLGYLGAPWVFRLMERAAAKPAATLALLAAWALTDAGLVAAGLAAIPAIGLPLGLAGALAVAATATLIAPYARRPRSPAALLRHAGERSIVVYLAFFLPMAATRAGLIAAGARDAGWIALAVTAVAVAVPLGLDWLTRATGHGRFLFARPAWASLVGGRAAGYQAAE